MKFQNRNTLFAAVSSAALVLFLGGCETSATVEATKHVADTTTAADAAFAQAKAAGSNVQTGAVREGRGLNLAGTVSRDDPGNGLPVALRDKSFAFVSATPLSFVEIGDLITRQTGLSVVTRDGGLSGTPAAAGGAAGGADLTSPRLATGPTPAGFDARTALAAAQAVSGGGGGGAPAVFAADGTMPVNYTGKLSGFLDLVADRFGLGWEYAEGRIEFSRTQIATFDVPALQFAMQLGFSLDSGSSASAGGGGSGVQQTGGSSQTAQTKAAYSVWEEIEATLRTIVGSSGSVIISGSTGTVTVNAPATIIREVRKYLAKINREVSKQINLTITMYSVRLNKTDNYKLDLNLVFSDGNLGAAGATFAARTAKDMLANVNDAGSGVGVAVIDPSSTFNGTSALVQALSTQGDVSVVRNTSVTTMNGIPAPFQLVNTRGYVAQVTTTPAVNSNGVTQTSLTPGSVTTGFNLYIVPRIDSSGRVLLQYGINVSELVGSKNGFDEFSTGGQTVQLPNINARNFVQVSAVPSGGTLVLTGFEQQTAGVNASGVGQAKLPLLGGARQAQDGREVVVIAISPRVISLGPDRAM